MNLLFGLFAVALLALFIRVATGIVRTDQSGNGSSRIALPFARGEKAYPMRRSPYRATSIVSGGSTCAAVQSLLQVKFLDLDDRVPALPLAGCNSGSCNCKYVRHADRREVDMDRRSPHTLTSELYDRSGRTNRRVGKGGRRKGDLDRRIIRYSFDDPRFQE